MSPGTTPTHPRDISESDIDSCGATDVGLVRSENQDCIFVGQEQGLYAVFDGMGGHRGGAAAAKFAKQAFVGVMQEGRGGKKPVKLLERACTTAGSVVHSKAGENRELRGMGTTVVALFMPRPNQALIAHVGDSRAYLLRKGRLRRLTSDHTVVAELVAQGKLTPEEAFYHPHASVLSRNLGGLPATKVDLLEVPLLLGDRILLCSDGLNGYATRSAIEQVICGAADCSSAATDLVDLALRGGGGDNVSVVVIDVLASRDSEKRPPMETGAGVWWSRRSIFVETCQRLGLAQSPLAETLSDEAALDLLGGSFCEAVYLDMKNTSGVHVWTYADSVVKAWFKRDGRYPPVKELFDVLREAALSVVEDLRDSDQNMAVHLEIALLRSLIVGEMVVGGQLSENIGRANDRFSRQSSTIDLPDSTFVNVATVPFAMHESPMPASPQVRRCLLDATERARSALPIAEHPVLKTIIDATYVSASEFSGEVDMAGYACELYGSRLLTEQELNPIFDALDSARAAHIPVIKVQNSDHNSGSDSDAETQAVALCSLALAHQSLYHALALVVVDAGKPTSDTLAEMHASTTIMKARLARNKQQLAELEGDLDTLEDM